jgi:hypothetical protein
VTYVHSHARFLLTFLVNMIKKLRTGKLLISCSGIYISRSMNVLMTFYTIMNECTNMGMELHAFSKMILFTIIIKAPYRVAFLQLHAKKHIYSGSHHLFDLPFIYLQHYIFLHYCARFTIDRCC